MLSVAVHKDIAEYQPKVVGKMTGRTLASIAGALGCSVLTGLYIYFVLGWNVGDNMMLIYAVSLPFWCCGFIRPKGIRDDKGKIVDWLWTFSDYPQDGNPHVENQHVGKPQLDSPHVGNQPQLNTKEENTNGESKKGASTDGYATAPAKAAPEKKGTYGRYRNVKLTDTDLSKLKAEFPDDWQERIDRLSTYMDSSGKSYKNHLATIRNWARRDAKREATSHKPLASNPGRREMTPEEVMEKHGCDYFTAQEMLCDGTY